jgi:hypothetical protein
MADTAAIVSTGTLGADISNADSNKIEIKV